MNDRELLELAAKAAGYWSNGFNCVDNLPHLGWNPLTDDGDAFRLAVMLNLTIGVESDAQAVWWAGDSLEDVNEPLGSDPFAAMRRAIVRAAAAIGKAMQ